MPDDEPIVPPEREPEREPEPAKPRRVARGGRIIPSLRPEDQPQRRGPAGDIPFAVQLVIGIVSPFVFGMIGTRLAVGIPIPGIASALVLGVVSCIYAKKVLRWPGFVVGFLIAIGLTALAFGLCIAAFAGWF